MTDLEEKALSDPAKETIEYLGTYPDNLLYSEDISGGLEM